MALRVYFASGGEGHSELNPAEKARRWRLYRELAPVLDRLAECSVVHTAYYLIQGLENFCPSSNDLRPIGVLCNGVSGPSAVKVKLRFVDASSGDAGWSCA
jgi:hypothetical protein